MVLLREARDHSDVALVEQCRNGDVSAFDEIVRRYQDRVYNVVYRFLGNREDALDVAQEVFVRAYYGLDGFRGDAKVFTWLYRIAVNLARNRLRDSGRKGRDKGTSLDALLADCPKAGSAVASTHTTPGDAATARELEEMLQRCLDELPEACRMTFVLRTFDDLSYDEIAGLMDCPRGTVKSRLNQARTLLRERLKELQVL